MSIAPLQLLVIEDNEDDFFLLQDALDTAFDKENITVEARRIDCAAAMEAALLEQSWDVIISDVCLPDFSAQAALEIYQAQQLDIPFIIISGVIREEDSVSLLKAGAHDFISKENFARLVPAILRELGDTAERHQHQQVKIAFHKDEEILEQIFATTNFLLAYMDKSFNFIRVNRAYAVAGKKQAEDFIGKNHFQLYPNQENEKIFQRVVDTGKPYFVQAKPFEHPEQIERNTTYWDWSLTPVTNALGETTGVLLSVVDVTDRIQAQIHAARLATVVEQAPVSIVITDTDANIIYTNPYFEKNTGYSAQEVLGKNPRMLQSGEHKSDFYENMWVQLTQGKTWFGHLINQRKNHQHYYEAASIFPIKDQAGKIVNYAAVKRDISAQIQAEKELKQHKNNLEELVTARTSKLQQLEQELKQIFELSIDMICIASMDGYFLKLNPAFEDILGYSKNELQAQSFFAFIHPEDRQKTKKMIQTQLGKGIQVLHFENRYRYKTGGYCWLEWNFHPEPQEQRIYAVARDISKRRHIEQQLLQAKEAAEAANRAKSIFLANMSHELRTPLNAILGFSQLMTHAPEVTLKQQEQLNTINRAGEHLLTMINDVLDLSKIEAGKTELHLENFDLHKMLKNLLEMFMFRAQTQGLSLEVEIDDSVLCYIQTDPGKLRQIITNLLGNALKFTKKGGITLRADCRLDSDQKLWLHIDVEDTGVGIEANQLQAIFSPFVQAYSILQMEQKGTGLGLAISRSFIELMGGSIHAQSTPGKGTLFHFKIPIKKSAGPRLLTKLNNWKSPG
ncbi:PAS domain S-box protein [Candidatus Venteria ishoeyi]|uniref:PAS domain S-box protein n=1 Tax=Candidatus Venteria ishoeyi TaxID=1899563 RepID=UPI0025A5D650|nr:PAS domain S-box protein [Candidatus Venteria ishoeyi]MDM8546013.1 PAS domain S-box protein [Candidatus Venteria ishoeyi]